jgi:hypothetical protein
MYTFLVITAALVGGELGENRIFLPMPNMQVCKFIVEQARVEEKSEIVYGMTCVSSGDVTAMLGWKPSGRDYWEPDQPINPTHWMPLPEPLEKGQAHGNDA